MAISDYFKSLQQGSNTPAPFANAPSGATQIQENLNTFMDPNSDYIQNARRRGVEYAATRGLGNSSIAAGAAERSALEAAAPLVQQATSIDQSRENALVADWADKQGFNRQLQSAVFGSALGMLNSVQQAAIQDPALYTPEVTSGFSNFFSKNMGDILKNYFGGM